MSSSARRACAKLSFEAMSERARHSTRQILARVAVAAILWFGAGAVVAWALGMSMVDSVAFLLCLGVVFLLGSVFYAAVWGPRGESEGGC